MTTEFSEAQLAVIPTTTEDALKLRVSIIYEDVASGLRAKQCLDRLTSNLDVGADVFALRLWSFGMLSDPAYRCAAAREAGNHEIIFLSMRDSGEPPSVLKEWLGEWLKCRNDQPGALAVSLEEKKPGATGDTPLLNYLTRVTKTSGLDLVYPCAEKPQHPDDHESIRQIVQRAINASPLLEGIVNDWEAYPHWGINEQERGYKEAAEILNEILDEEKAADRTLNTLATEKNEEALEGVEN